MRKMVLGVVTLMAFGGLDAQADEQLKDDIGLTEQEVTPKAIIKKYIDAVGGETVIKNIRNLEMLMEAEVQGMTIKIKGITDQENDRSLNLTEMNGNVVAKTVIKGGLEK